MTTAPRPDLHRSFIEASPDGEERHELLRAMRRRTGKIDDWDWLLASRIAVVLNEAGAGKTIELMDQARRLQGDREGFFLRIERLCGPDFKTAFETADDYLRFERWRRSRREGVFFLDSVDEAKLPRDLIGNPLSLAIQRVEQSLTGLTRRVRFVISSRPSAWTPEMELAEVKRLADTFRTRGVTTGDGDAPLTRFVTLAPLDADQRQTLAAWAEAPEGFLDALYSSGSADFARTPLDLLDFVEAYAEEIDAGRPGEAVFSSLTTMTDRAIARRINEIGAERPRNHLPFARTREGARRIAAACVLGQQLTVRLPGSRGQGIDAIAALEGAGEAWSRPEIDQLLACGLFTAAWEGTVRFHHRRTMERLAAEAFDALHHAGMALESLVDVLTPKAFDQVTTPGPFVQTLGWLASLNPAFRRHLLLHAPQHLLDTGDPASHPLNVREQALRGNAARYAGGISLSEWFDYALLKRFLDPSLEAVVCELMASAPGDDPRRLMLDLAELGQFHGCAPEALRIVEDAAAEVDLRTRALTTLASIGGSVELAQAAQAVRRFRPPVSTDGHKRHANNRLRLYGVGTCRPDAMSLSQALGVLMRIERRHRQYSSSGDYRLVEALAIPCPPERLPFLLRWLSRMCWADTPRTFGDYDAPRWTDAGYYLLPVLEAVVARVVSERPDLHGSPLLVDQVDRLFATRSVSLGPLRRDRDDEDEPDALLLAIQGAAPLRQAVFSTAAAIPSGRRADGPGAVLERLATRHGLLSDGEVAPEDLDWMADAFSNDPDERQRKALVDAIRYRLHVLRGRDRARQVKRFKQLANARGDLEAVQEFDKARNRPIRSLQWSVERAWKRRRWKRRSRRSSTTMLELKIAIELLWRRRQVRSGERIGLIWRAAFGPRFPDEPLAEAAKRYGTRAAEDLASGIKAFARTFDDNPDFRRRSARSHVAITGWAQIATDDPAALLVLSPAEARRALQAAVDSNGFPDWGAALADRHPEVFQALMAPSVATELSWKSGDLRYAPALSLLSRQSAALQSRMAREVMDGLGAGEPDLAVILPAATVIHSDNQTRAELVSLAARRCRAHVSEGRAEPAAAWLAVWLDLDPQAAWGALQAHDLAYGLRSDGLIREILGYMGEGAPLKDAPPDLLAAVAVRYLELFPPELDDDESGDTTRRHTAERMRGRIPGLIAEQPSPEAHQALLDLGQHPAFAAYPSWIARMLREQALVAATPRPWPASSTAGFMATFLKRPANAEEFRGLIERQIEAIAIDLATSEFDRRGLLRDVIERDVRAFFAEALQNRSQGWFSVTQETVTSGEKRTDLRIEGRSKAGEIVIVELKLAGGSWRGDQLVDHLETQLVDQYLISRRVRHGIYLVVDLGIQKSWEMSDGTTETFDGLVTRMNARIPALLTRPTVDSITVLPLRIEVPPRETRKRKPPKNRP